MNSALGATRPRIRHGLPVSVRFRFPSQSDISHSRLSHEASNLI